MADEKISILVTLKDQASKGLKGLSSGFGNFKSIVGGMLTANILTKVASQMVNVGKTAIKTAAQLEQERQGFITLLGSAEAADEALEMIKKDAAATPFELPGLIQANKLLTTVTKDAKQSEKFLLDIGKALAAAGKGQAELDRVIVNLQQIGSVGKASMLDIKQFAFAGIPIFDLLTEATGKSGEALQDMISGGEVSFELLQDVFAKAGAAGGQFADAFTNQMGTLSQMTSNLKDSLTIMGTEIVKETGLFDGLKNALGFVNDNMGLISESIKSFIQAIKDTATPVIEGFMNTIDFTFLKETADKFMAAIQEQMPRIRGVLEKVGVVFGKIANLVGKIVNILVDSGAIKVIAVAFDALVSVLSIVLDVFGKILDVVTKIIKKIAESKFGQFVGGVVGGIGDFFSGLGKTESVNDFIVTKSGKVLETNPNDTIIGTKTPGSLGSGVNVYIDTVQGLDPTEVARALQSALSGKVKY